jgi:4-diphosphocytidyl-2-C-methyl-D-erythritol kinase
MRRYEAPAKLNLALLVHPPDSDGHHPLESLVQTVEWCDLLEVSPGEGSDHLEVLGADLDPEDNLVLRALEAVRKRHAVPALSMQLTKEIPLAAGLGGGSSDAAAALLAAGDFGEVERQTLSDVAPEVGADVALFLTGGTLEMSGRGEVVEPLPPLEGFAVAVAIPDFGLSTAEVYRRWDEMEGPTGEVVAEHLAPPTLRGGMPLRNDLAPAAISLEPRLGDFMADLRALWGTAVCLTGSGSACFGYFPTVDEAADAATAATSLADLTRPAALRHRGVARHGG